jgi:CheY-like chemotaxis protein
MTPLRILLVDDDKDEIISFRQAIEELRMDCDVVFANGADELFSILATQQIDVIFLDLNMPVKSGKECLKELKDHALYKNIPVVTFTLNISSDDIDETYKNGAHHYVIKPYSEMNYRNTLNKVFQKDWKSFPPIPQRQDFVINMTYI